MGDLAGILQSGGPIVRLLIALSVFSLALICVKTLSLRGVLGGEANRATAFDHWSTGDKTAAMRRADINGTLGSIGRRRTSEISFMTSS